MDKHMLSQIAEEAGVDVEAVLTKERAVTRRPKLVSRDMTSLYRKDPSAFGKQDAIDDQTYARLVRETMEKYAQEGDTVIVGRGGQMILQEWKNLKYYHLAIDTGRISPQIAAQMITMATQRESDSDL